MNDSETVVPLRHVLQEIEIALVAGPNRATETFARHTDPDYIFTSAEGTVSSRTEILESLQKGAVEFSAYSMTDLDIHEFDDWALVIGRATGGRGESRR